MVYLQTTYELCFGEAYFEYFELCDFSHGNTNIDVSVFMFDLRMINMSSECEYDWYWKISACSTEYEACDSFASLTRHQTSYSGSAGWYFQYQSIHIQITYTSQTEGGGITHNFQSLPPKKIYSPQVSEKKFFTEKARRYVELPTVMKLQIKFELILTQNKEVISNKKFLFLVTVNKEWLSEKILNILLT